MRAAGSGVTVGMLMTGLCSQPPPRALIKDTLAVRRCPAIWAVARWVRRVVRLASMTSR